VTNRMRKEYEDKYEEEPGVTQCFKDLVKPGMIVLDVGANIGAYTRLALDLGARVVAFEPFLKSYTELVKLSCDKLLTFNRAVMDYDGDTRLYLSTVGHQQHCTYKCFDKTEYITVGCIKIDNYDYMIRADMVKIDVDGSEWEVLKGMEQLIEKNKHINIIMEYNQSLIQKSGHDWVKFLLYIDQELKLKRIDLGDGNVLLQHK